MRVITSDHRYVVFRHNHCIKIFVLLPELFFSYTLLFQENMSKRQRVEANDGKIARDVGSSSDGGVISAGVSNNSAMAALANYDEDSD